MFTELFDLNDEREIGHIRLSREADLIVVAPATADLLAKMAGGHADDLASCVLMATDKPVLVAPAMNPRMWLHPATRRNVALLQADGIHFIGPDIGEMAERGEAGPGRMSEVPELVEAIGRLLASPLPLVPEARLPDAGGDRRRGDTPQGAVPSPAATCSSPAARRTSPSIPCATSPTAPPASRARPSPPRPRRSAPASRSSPARPRSPPPAGVEVVHVETAREMLDAVRAALPADIAIFAAAVADWRVASQSSEKIKKGAKGAPSLELVENPDILKTIASDRPGKRPPLVIGFAAETENVIEHAKKKRKAKGADWIVANDVSPETGIMGGDRNTVHLITGAGRRKLARTRQGPGRATPRRPRRRMARRKHRRDMTRKPAKLSAAHQGRASAARPRSAPARLPVGGCRRHGPAGRRREAPDAEARRARARSHRA